MSSRRWVFETSPEGRQFVQLKRSHSHHYHHRRRHEHRCCRDDCCHAGADEWNDLVLRERKLRENNEILVRQNHTLRCDFQAAETESRRLGGILPVLQAENRALREENAQLRCSTDNADGNVGKYHREIERLRQKLERIERERDALIARVKELARHCVTDRVEELRRIIASWERKFEGLDDHNKRLRRDIERQQLIIRSQDERILAYERILRRHGF